MKCKKNKLSNELLSEQKSCCQALLTQIKVPVDSQHASQVNQNSSSETHEELTAITKSKKGRKTHIMNIYTPGEMYFKM